MDNQTLFYICGIAAAVSAVVVSFIGLKVKTFPGKAFPIVILWFAILIGGAATFSVLHAKDEEQEKAAEFEKAGEEFEAEGNDDEAAETPNEGEAAGGEGGGAPQAAVTGPGGTLQIAADPTNIAYDKTSLASKPGKVTIDLDNPSAISHDIAIEDDAGKEIAGSELVAEGKTEVTAELAAGTYTFFCTVPGHREAGMEGPLEVQ